MIKEENEDTLYAVTELKRSPKCDVIVTRYLLRFLNPPNPEAWALGGHRIFNYQELSIVLNSDYICSTDSTSRTCIRLIYGIISIRNLARHSHRLKIGCKVHTRIFQLRSPPWRKRMLINPNCFILLELFLQT